MKFFFILLLFTFYSCKNTTTAIQITGALKNSNLKKVYLMDSYEWEIPLDSCEVINGTFSFTRKEVDFKLYSIYSKDTVGNLKSIEFINRVLSPETPKFYTNYFMLDSSIVQISGDWNVYKNHYYEITAGSENKALLRTQMIQFGYLDPEKSKRASQLNEYFKIIAEYPNSNYLLTQLNTNKSTATKKELQQMLSKFSTKALESNIGKSLSKYTLDKKEDVYFDNVLLNNSHGNKTNLLDSSAKINMLVFWASWCGPCRQEVPMLKELYTKYKGKGLSITSVSIDEKKDEWLIAVAIDKVPWTQLIIPIQNMETFKNNYEINGIPYIIFTDRKGKLITRTIGSEKADFKTYTEIIEKQLNKN
jgi:thiol-disulfide isomerase/thioredoxin